MGNLASSVLLTRPEKFATEVNGVDFEPATWRNFDYTVVGGGTAGCVLASRLSEDVKTTVLLVEGGSSHIGRTFSRLPLGYTKLFGGPLIWNGQTTYPKLGNRTIYLPRGKLLGGSSSINAMTYHRCAPEDFDEWVSKGAAGWGYEDLKPYFLKAEGYTPHPDGSDVHLSNHGLSGPWKTSHRPVAPSSSKVLQACQEVDIKYTPDFSVPAGTLGCSPTLAFVDKNGERSSPATAYLTKQILSRPNLHVAINITTDKILFSKEADGKPRAVGVEVSTGPSAPKYRVAARREVLVCAGTIGTPQLLMLSGVGPADELTKNGIPSVCELPAVGRNMYDHISAGAIVFRAKARETWDYLTAPLNALFAIGQWFVTGTGPMSATSSQGRAFVRLDDPLLPQSELDPPIKDLTSGPGAPDVLFIWAPVVAQGGQNKALKGASGVTMAPVALRPESTGTVTLRSGSAWDMPIVNPNYFASKHDIDVLVRATRLILRVARTESLRGVLKLLDHSTDTTDVFWPGDADPDKITGTEIKEWLERNATSSWHYVGTCKMGKDRATSVVDPDLCVHGVEGLRIIDASIFPTSLSGHTTAPVVAIAEKASDMLKNHVPV